MRNPHLPTVSNLKLSISLHDTSYPSGGIFHDNEAFEQPDLFNPDRFLKSEYGTKEGVSDTGRRHDLVFGGGRVRVYGWCNSPSDNLIREHCSEFALGYSSQITPSWVHIFQATPALTVLVQLIYFCRCWMQWIYCGHSTSHQPRIQLRAIRSP